MVSRRSSRQPSVDDYSDYDDRAPSSPTPATPRITRRERDQLSTFAAATSAFMDLIECAFHTILFERDIYPSELFIAARKYNCPVKQCRAPKVNDYIRKAVEMVSEEVLSGEVQAVHVVILSPNDEPLERFAFEVSSFPRGVNRAQRHSLFLNPDPDHEMTDPAQLQGMSLPDLNEQFRAIMMKLSVCSAGLGKLPEECSYTVMLELKDGSMSPVNKNGSWIVAERQPEPRNPHSMLNSSRRGVRYTPLRTVEAGALSMECWIEESTVKLKCAA